MSGYRLQQHDAGGTRVWYKVIQGEAHPSFRGSNGRQKQPIGIAIRTAGEPVGYIPFHARNDFDLSGEVTIKEKLATMLPIDMSAAASPHTELVRQAAGDPEFTGAGSSDLPDITRQVYGDQLQHAMTAAQGVFVDSMMQALGGPLINNLTKQLIKSKVKQFIVSKSVSAGVKKHLKSKVKVDLEKDRILD